MSEHGLGHGASRAAGADGPTPGSRFLVLARAGDSSLHPAWLEAGGGRSGRALVKAASDRGWDLHLSYFGKADEPRKARAPNVTWSHDPQPSKWPGVAAALRSGKIDLDRYDYIALPDDDIVADAATWLRAFRTAQKHRLGACQLSLLHGSFFGHRRTLRIPGLELHYTSRVELMAPILRVDVLRALIPWLELDDNFWGIEHVVAHLLRDEPRSIAVLDTASVLHTRRFWTSGAYDAFRSAAADPRKVERDFLDRHGVPWIAEAILGGVRLDGRPIDRVWWTASTQLGARALRKLREVNHRALIATVREDEIVLLRRFSGCPAAMVKPRIVLEDERRFASTPVKISRPAAQTA
ncbi:hypothetical protein GC169_02845 [bacterium]|nr:hypothetical protein [bacterium]